MLGTGNTVVKTQIRSLFSVFRAFIVLAHVPAKGVSGTEVLATFRLISLCLGMGPHLLREKGTFI